MDRPDAVSDVADCDLKKPNRRAEAAQRRRFFEPRAVRRRRCRFGIFRHRFSDDHLAAATLTFGSRRNIHGGAEVVEHVSRRDCDARSGVKSEVQHDRRCARASASGGVEACDIVLDRESRTDRV
jgi:hypothetical protein